MLNEGRKLTINILSTLKYLLPVIILVVYSSLVVSAAPADFAVNSQYVSAKLSPDGDKLGVIVRLDAKRRLVVFSLLDFQAIGGLDLGKQNEVGEFYWANSERIVIEVHQSVAGIEESRNYGELFSVDFDGSQPKLIYGYRAGGKNVGTHFRQNEATRGWADIISLLPNDEKHILISSTKMSDNKGKLPTVHKLNIYTGRLSNIITQSPVPLTGFVSKPNGDLAFAVGRDKNNDKKSFRFENDRWVEISATVGDAFRPLALDSSSENLFFLDNFMQDKQGLFKLNLTTGAKTNVYTDDVVDVRNVNFTSDKSAVYALRIDDGYPSYVVFNSSGDEADVFKSLLARFQGQRVSITSRSKDRTKWVLHVSSDINPGRFYLYNKPKDSLTALFSNMAHLKPQHMAKTSPIVFSALDGKNIHGYLTYPSVIAEDSQVPLITVVHGGPHGVRDFWYFDRQTQMLAAQGYAVLQINFRGSNGYGAEYLKSGYRQWGNAIQQDIIEGTKWAIAQGKIDSEKVCIMGASFGGYSAMMSSVLAPDLFKCAVATAGIYDLEMARESGDVPNLLYGTSYLDTAIGNDVSELRAFSPITFIEKLKATVLIAHGEKDMRVPFEQAKALKKALDKHNKPYSWFVKSSETHGFYDDDNRKEYFEAVAEFLGKHLKDDGQ